MVKRNGERDWVRKEIYEPFVNGGRFKNNPSINREALLVRMYKRIMSEMCVNRFSWSGLPDTVDRRYLEATLMYDGLAVFYFDEEFDRFMALRATGLGQVNMYDNPTNFTVYGNQVFSKTLDARHCVPIWSNYLREPDWDIIDIYSQRLAAFDRTLEVNMLSARHPFVFSVDNNEYQSFVNAFRKVAEGQPVIFGTEALSPAALAEKVTMFDVGFKPHQIQDVMEAKVKTWNEALTLLGIMNVNSEKRERMVAEEASGSSGQVLAMRAVAMNARKYACEHINQMYGLQVDVRWNLDESQPADAQNAMLAAAALGGIGDALDKGNPDLGTTDQQELNPNNG